MSILIGKKNFIYGKTVKLNGQSETLHACWQRAAIDDVLISIPS